LETLVINDPLYGSIQLQGAAVALVDTDAFQRLRRIRQLGLAHYVYPTANHTRFEHPIGVYHLFRVITDRMKTRGELLAEDEEVVELGCLAAILHDISHAGGGATHPLEEYGMVEADHEAAGERRITTGEVAEVLASTGMPDAAARIARMIRHDHAHPLSALVAGAVDCDRLDYHRRDAFYCWGAHGPNFHQDRLLHALTLQLNPHTGRREVMLHEKGLSPLEQMLWQRYNLYKNVYWHRRCRSAAVMTRSLVIQASEAGIAHVDEFGLWNDEQLFFVLEGRVAGLTNEASVRIRDLCRRLWGRDLFEVACRIPPGGVPVLAPVQIRAVERRLAQRLGLPPHGALLDIPNKPGMFEPDISILFKDGRVVHRRDLGPEDGFVMAEVAPALYRAAGSVRLYTSAPRSLASEELFAEIVSEA
jgi:uncharacterized protein